MKNIEILISVDWEGTDLEKENLKRIRKFKKDWNIPLTHYLNAGYYSNPKTAETNVTEKIQWTLDECDELGVHLHAPKHLVRSAGVGLKTTPCFSASGDYNLGEELGQEVMLHTYSQDEMDRLIGYSKSVLSTKGFKSLQSFRAGGWMSDQAVFESLRPNGFRVESSATVASLLNGSSWEGDNLQRYISIIWSDITQDSDPYLVETTQGSLLEIPNNLGAVDYWQEDWIVELADRCMKNANEKGTHLAVVNTHQETAAKHWDKLDRFLTYLLSHTDYSFSFLTNDKVAKKYLCA